MLRWRDVAPLSLCRPWGGDVMLSCWATVVWALTKSLYTGAVVDLNSGLFSWSISLTIFYFLMDVPVPKKDYSQVVNEECGLQHVASVKSLEFTSKTQFNKDSPEVSFAVYVCSIFCSVRIQGKIIIYNCMCCDLKLSFCITLGDTHSGVLFLFQEGRCIEISLAPETMSRNEFIQEG